MKKLLILLLGNLFFSNPLLATERVSQIKIDSYEINDDFCKDMKRFKAPQVLEFFKKAKAISPEDLHDLDQLNCHVHGSLTKGGGNYKFDIQPIGIGRLIDSKTGKEDIFACKSCDKLFPPPEK